MYFVVADVSDKGTPAALFMARTKTMIRLVATLYRLPDGGLMEPHRIIEKVNEGLSLENQQGMFVTVFLGILDPATAVLSFCNAGHNLPYLLSAADGVSVLDGARGKALGIRPTFTYQTASLKLAPGDGLFVYTDGITEALNTAGEMFEDERLKDALCSLGGASAREIVGRAVLARRGFRKRNRCHGHGARPDICSGRRPGRRYCSNGAAVCKLSQTETTIRNRREEFSRVVDAVDRFAAEHRLSVDDVGDLQVALDEILTNIVDYGYTDDSDHEIRIRLQVIGNVLEATIVDDGFAFNPLESQAPDVRAPLHERRVGGLGIHFVKNLMTEITYDRVDGRNLLVLRKNLTT